jgi:hypothetical protein
MNLTPIDINIVDSRDDSKLTYLIVNDCKVSVLKVKLNDICYVMKLVNSTCHIELDNQDCRKAQK